MLEVGDRAPQHVLRYSKHEAIALLSELYRDRDCIEKDFRHIKSEIELRPMWHHTDAKVRAHVTLCMLALLVDRTLERALRNTGCPMTATALYEALRPLRLNRCQAQGAAKPFYLLTNTEPDQLEILKALSMNNLVGGRLVAERIVAR